MSDTVDIEIEDEETTEEVEAEAVDPGVATGEEEPEEEQFEGERAVTFGEAAGSLAETFDIDARSGETITDLSTVETEDGRQLVATVERRRRTAIGARLADARRTGRRLGTVAILLGAAAVALSALRSRDDDDELDIEEI
ncbi:hypothetical protein [Halomarina rubra]|uniref:Uncharacterized protein n=1 Tax=Halomarina rubra TaxID=2071873 RepID=A0ABD6AS72_9EURY|nr:hypothetical protein [Halomarina rubra]